MLKIIIEKVSQSENFHLPKYHSDNSSGIDVTADIKDSVNIKQNEIFLAPTGIKLKIPKGYEGQIRPRSGLAAKNGITVLNSPGTIDSDYRGEIKIILINLGIKEFLILPGMRVAQMVISPTTQAELNVFTEIKSDTTRGNKGFGSTGL